MWQCRTQISQEGGGNEWCKKTSIRKDRGRKKCRLLTWWLALPNANRLVIYQGTIWIISPQSDPKSFLQQLHIVWLRNPTLLILLCIIPILNLILKRNSPLLRKIPHQLEELSKNMLFDALKESWNMVGENDTIIWWITTSPSKYPLAPPISS